MKALGRVAAMATGYLAGTWVMHHDAWLIGPSNTMPGDHGDPLGLMAWIVVTVALWVISDGLTTKDGKRH